MGFPPPPHHHHPPTPKPNIFPILPPRIVNFLKRPRTNNLLPKVINFILMHSSNGSWDGIKNSMLIIIRKQVLVHVHVQNHRVYMYNIQNACSQYCFIQQIYTNSARPTLEQVTRIGRGDTGTM